MEEEKSWLSNTLERSGNERSSGIQIERSLYTGCQAENSPKVNAFCILKEGVLGM